MRRRSLNTTGATRRLRTGLGFVLTSLLALSSCSSTAAPKTTPAPAPKIVRLPGFHLAVPAGKGWQTEVDTPARSAFLTKKWGGFSRWLTDEQRIAEISVTAFLVPTGQWSSDGDELREFLKNEHVLDLGTRLTGGWKTLDRGGRRLHYQVRQIFIDGTEESTGLTTLNDDPHYKEKRYDGVYFPDDLERTHRYFEFCLTITFIDTIARLHDSPDLSLLEAALAGLEIVGSFDDMPNPAGDLARAVVRGDDEAVLNALAAGADVDAAIPDWTLFELAAQLDRRALVPFLERGGALGDALGGPTAPTPLLLALVAGQPDIAALLVEKGARTGPGSEGSLQPLALAAGLGYSRVMSALIASGASPDARSEAGRTPLMFAAEANALDSLRALIDNGATLDLRAADGATALLTAVDWGRFDAMRLLLEKGADVDIPDDEGWSCLLLAVFQGNEVLVEELIAAGADIDANVYETGQTGLVLALERDQFGIARTLIEAGADVNLHKEGRATPLMAAAEKGRSDLVKLLLERGAEINARTDDGKTARAIAEQKGFAEVVDLLVKAGARK